MSSQGIGSTRINALSRRPRGAYPCYKEAPPLPGLKPKKVVLERAATDPKLGRKSRFDDQTLDGWRARYESGETVYSIAKSEGLRYDVVGYYRKSRGWRRAA